jgi:hypothetical protein
MHSNVMLRFMLQAFQDPLLCSRTEMSLRMIKVFFLLSQFDEELLFQPVSKPKIG